MVRTSILTSALSLAFLVMPQALLAGSPWDAPVEEAAQSLTADTVFRGQSPVTLGQPQPITSYYQDPTFAQPGAIPGGYVDPYYGGGGYMGTTDPWLGGGGGYVDPYANSYGYGIGAGLNGAQPYKFGWTERFDAAWFSSESASAGGTFQLTEFNYDKEYVTPFGGWIATINPQYNLRLFEGPGVVAPPPDIPGSAHRFGLGMKLATQSVNGWTFEGGFNPAIATDFSGGLSRDSWQFDGHLVGYWQASRQWMWALGATYWDRVDGIVLPYAGAVWTPNDYLEVRAIFPKPRISIFLGTPNAIATWAYLQGEYHVESYQIGVLNSANQKVQFEDWRVSAGFYGEAGWYTGFAEVGWVFDRKVKYSGASPGFTINDGLFVRTGLRF
ncbi:MAG: hypothetical protein R3C01_06315 [Planctomycetaceae bacterium]